MKALCWHWDSNHNLLTQVLSFAATFKLQEMAIFMAPHSWAPFKRPGLWGTTFQRSLASSLKTQSSLSQNLLTLEEICCPSAWLICSCSRVRHGFCQQYQEHPSRNEHISLVRSFQSDHFANCWGGKNQLRQQLASQADSQICVSK